MAVAVEGSSVVLVRCSEVVAFVIGASTVTDRLPKMLPDVDGSEKAETETSAPETSALEFAVPVMTEADKEKGRGLLEAVRE